MAIKDFSIVPVQQTYVSYANNQWHDSWDTETYRDVFNYAAKLSSDIPLDVLNQADAFLHVSDSVIPLTTNTDAGDFEECVKLRHKLTLTDEDEYENTYTYTADARPMMYDWAASSVQTTYTSTAWDDMESALADSYDKIGNVECISTSSNSSDYYTYEKRETVEFYQLTAALSEYYIDANLGIQTRTPEIITTRNTSDMAEATTYTTFESNGSTLTSCSNEMGVFTFYTPVISMSVVEELEALTYCNGCGATDLTIDTYERSVSGSVVSAGQIYADVILTTRGLHTVSASLSGAYPSFISTIDVNRTQTRSTDELPLLITTSDEYTETYKISSVQYSGYNSQYDAYISGISRVDESRLAYCSVYQGTMSNVASESWIMRAFATDVINKLAEISNSDTFILTSSRKLDFVDTTYTFTSNITTSTETYKTYTHYNTHSLFSFEARRWSGWMPQLGGKL